MPPPLQLIKELPADLNSKSIEQAVWGFITEVDVKGDIRGFFNQTIESIANATFLRKGGDFWLSWENNTVVGYALASISTDVDGQLTYSVYQAWASPDVRRTPWVKDNFRRIRDQAKKYMCRHFMIISGRDTKAYLRWLGGSWHEYVTILKEDI
jgi:hypothetical protein